MTTRELIEAVREPVPVMYDWRSAEPDGPCDKPAKYVRAADYDALRAATLAVLDEVIVSIDSREPMPWESLANARALRERVKG